jgi:hypothetical protein
MLSLDPQSLGGGRRVFGIDGATNVANATKEFRSAQRATDPHKPEENVPDSCHFDFWGNSVSGSETDSPQKHVWATGR